MRASPGYRQKQPLPSSALSSSRASLSLSQAGLQLIDHGFPSCSPASDRQFIEKHTPAAALAAHLSPPPHLTWSDFLTPTALADCDVPVRTTTYRRWHSVAAPRASTTPPSPKSSAALLAALAVDVSEDFFSTDLPDAFLREVVFESVAGPVGIVMAGRDMTFPDGLEVGGWYGRLRAALPEGARVAEGGVVEGADHCFSEGEAPRQLAEMVVGFLKRF